MRLGTDQVIATFVEAIVLLMVLHVAHLVAEAQVVARRHVEDGATDVSFALPDATNDAIDMINLQKSVQVEL